LGAEPVTARVQQFLDAVDEAYRESDRDRAMLERALEISSHELLEANSKMKAVLQATTDVFLQVAIDGHVIDHKSDDLIELFCSHAEVGARRNLALKPELRMRFTAAIAGLLAGQAFPSFDFKPSATDHRVFEIRILKLFHDQAVIYIRDVTERRAEEVQLRESEERYRNLFDSNPHPMWVYDVKTLAFLAVNNAAVQHYGYSQDEFLAMTIKDIRSPETVPLLLQVIHDTPEGPFAKVYGVFEHRKKDGSKIEVEIASSGIVFQAREAGVVLAMDVTEKRRLEREREIMQRQLEQGHRITSLGHLAATMAHEFNNVLMGIQPFVEVIAREAAALPKVQVSAVRINSAIKRGKRVTGEILNFTRETPLIRKPIALKEWMAGLEAEAAAVLGTGIELCLYTEDALVVAGDGSHLQQVFLNLMTNARDAMGGTGRLAIEVRRGAGSGTFSFGAIENAERFAHFIVTDSGAGISPEVLRHIFEPLFTTKASGTGLGLALTRRIVEQHEGRIFVESEVGRGTAVHVFLPLSNAQCEYEQIKPSFFPLGMRKLALIEDDEDVVAGLEMFFALEGIKVSVARTGGEALDVIASMHPDAVLLDVGLPDISGIDLYAQIAGRWPSLPVIFATGHADVSHLPDLTKPHVGYLLKPYESAELMHMLKLVSESREESRSTMRKPGGTIAHPNAQLQVMQMNP
jgi:PAS domain S-box-containing protein